MVINDSSGLNHSEDGGHAEDHHASFHLVSMQFSEVKVPFFVTVFLLLASGVKTVFHLSKKVTKIIPESCLLVILGKLNTFTTTYHRGKILMHDLFKSFLRMAVDPAIKAMLIFS